MKKKVYRERYKEAIIEVDTLEDGSNIAKETLMNMAKDFVDELEEKESKPKKRKKKEDKYEK